MTIKWLQSFATQLGQMFGEEVADDSTRTKAATQFFLDTLQLIADSQGDRQKVYSVWAQQQEKFNPEMLAMIPQVISQLFEQYPEQQRSIASHLETFGNLIQRFSLGERWLNLELSIASYKLALQVRTHEVSPEQWAATQNNLASAYSYRIRGDHADNLEQAIAACKLALKVFTREAFPTEWATIKNNLSTIYLSRIQGDRSDNLEEAIAACQEALTVRSQVNLPIEWATTQNNLAIAYRNRILDSRADNLEQAIVACQQALRITTQIAMPVEWAQTKNNLGNIYRDRIRGDRAENIEQSIAAHLEALTVMTQKEMPVDWAQTMMNLANAYSERIRGNRGDNIERAISAYQNALMIITQEKMPVLWSTIMHNLANVYPGRAYGDQAENIEQTIAICQKILRIRTQENAPLEWAKTMKSLANAYSQRIHGDRDENIEQAIKAYKQAIIVMTQDAMPVDWAGTMNNLANAYSQRIRGDHAENIEQAIKAYDQSLTLLRPEILPKECRMASHNLGDLHLKQKQWVQAKKAYSKALKAAEILYQNANLLDSKSAEIAKSEDLFRKAAYAHARTSDFRKSIEILEQGRARGLSETIDRDRINLNQLKVHNKNLYIKYKETTQQLRILEIQQRERMISAERDSITPEALRNEVTRLRQELTTTISQIRQQPGYETFLALPTFEDVRQAATPECPLIYLLTTFTGSLALIVTPDTIDHIRLDQFTEENLREILYGFAAEAEMTRWFGTYQKFHNDSKATYLAWCEEIERTTQELWELLIGPLIRKLQILGCDRITLIPTGYLSLLPIHAAWTPDDTKPTGRRYTLDNIHITYAPNAKSLTAARTISDRVQADSILAIDNPRSDLPNSSGEVQTAVSTFLQPTVLRHDQATVDQVRSQLPNATIAHFSCHGTANLTEPLTSGLLMSDGLFTLKDIFALNLAETGGLRLAVLSACETGVQGIENADEAISLPTGLLQAGVAAVISSLWAVSDIGTMMLLTRFYDLWRNAELEPPIALTQAQQWVRDTTNQQKYDYLKSHFQALVSQGHMSEQEVNLLLSEFMIHYIYGEGPNSWSFAHPFHWAAFSYTGV